MTDEQILDKALQSWCRGEKRDWPSRSMSDVYWTSENTATVVLQNCYGVLGVYGYDEKRKRPLVRIKRPVCEKCLPDLRCCCS